MAASVKRNYIPMLYRHDRKENPKRNMENCSYFLTTTLVVQSSSSSPDFILKYVNSVVPCFNKYI